MSTKNNLWKLDNGELTKTTSFYSKILQPTKVYGLEMKIFNANHYLTSSSKTTSYRSLNSVEPGSLCAEFVFYIHRAYIPALTTYINLHKGTSLEKMLGGFIDLDPCVVEITSTVKKKTKEEVNKILDLGSSRDKAELKKYYRAVSKNLIPAFHSGYIRVSVTLPLSETVNLTKTASQISYYRDIIKKKMSSLHKDVMLEMELNSELKDSYMSILFEIDNRIQEMYRGDLCKTDCDAVSKSNW